MLISTCVDTKLRQAITRTVERLGGTVTSSPADFSVFVTLDAARGDKDRGFTKSLNALSALASGDSSYVVLSCSTGDYPQLFRVVPGISAKQASLTHRSNGTQWCILTECMKKRKKRHCKEARSSRTISLIRFLA